MIVWLILILRLAAASLKSRRNLLLENLTLQHQLLVLSRGSKRPRLTPLDRALWIWLSHTWNGWKGSLRILQPDTVIQWHRAGFRLFWRWKSPPRKAGRRTICPDIITLIREMNHANQLWGCSSDPRRVAQARYHRCSTNRHQIHGPAQWSPRVPQLEGLPSQSPRQHGFGRLLHRS